MKTNISGYPIDAYQYIRQYGTLADIENFETMYGKPKEIPGITLFKKSSPYLQSNELIESGQELSSVETRIVRSLLSLLEPYKQTRFTQMSILISDLARQCGLNPKNAYRQINDACDSIMRKPIIFKRNGPHGAKIIRRPWFTRLDTQEGKGVLSFQFHPELVDDLLQFHTNERGYVKSNTDIIDEIKDGATIRLFELMLKNAKLGECEYSIAEFVFMLQLEDKYISAKTGKTDPAKLINKIIAPAIKKINSLTYLYVTYTAIKHNRKTERISFRIIPDPIIFEDNLLKDKYTTVLLNENVSLAIKNLQSLGLNQFFVTSVLKKYIKAEPEYTKCCNQITEAANYAANILAAQTETIPNPGLVLFRLLMEYTPVNA